MAKKVRIELDFDNGDLVNLVTDPDKFTYQVVCVKFDINGAMYEIQHAYEDPFWVYSFQIKLQDEN